MIRKSLVAVAAVAVLGMATIPMTSAGAFSDRAGFDNRAAFNNNRAAFNNRFVARNNIAHNRFDRRRPFVGGRFGFASCSFVRRVWTPWGWRWRRVWVC